MPQFEEFKKKHGPGTQCRPATEKSLKAYRKLLPESLIAEWEEAGWCAYGEGLVWIVNPDELKAAVKEWLGASNKALPFARSAFGHLFLWDEKGAHMLDPHYGTIAKLIDDIPLVLNYTFCSKQYLDKVLDQKLFRKSLKKLGALDFDECYGFEPAIALGGPGTLDTIRKVKLREHLSILAQLVEEVRQV
jgi:hypothetical protein